MLSSVFKVLVQDCVLSFSSSQHITNFYSLNISVYFFKAKLRETFPGTGWDYRKD